QIVNSLSGARNGNFNLNNVTGSQRAQHQATAQSTQQLAQQRNQFETAHRSPGSSWRLPPATGATASASAHTIEAARLQNRSGAQFSARPNVSVPNAGRSSGSLPQSTFTAPRIQSPQSTFAAPRIQSPAASRLQTPSYSAPSRSFYQAPSQQVTPSFRATPAPTFSGGRSAGGSAHYGSAHYGASGGHYGGGGRGGGGGGHHK